MSEPRFYTNRPDAREYLARVNTSVNRSWLEPQVELLIALNPDANAPIDSWVSSLTTSGGPIITQQAAQEGAYSGQPLLIPTEMARAIYQALKDYFQEPDFYRPKNDPVKEALEVERKRVDRMIGHYLGDEVRA